MGRNLTELHLFILYQFAVFLPLSEQLRLNPELFLVKNSKPIDIIIAILLFWLILPAIFLVVVRLVKRNHLRVGERMSQIIFAFLLFIMALISLNKIVRDPPIIVLSLAALIAFAIGYGYLRFSSIRSFFTFLFPVILIPPVLFFMNPSISKLFHSPEIMPETVTVKNPIPVILIIFDQFPMSSLVNERNEIDTVHFPNFARLSADSIWFRNASSVSPFTTEAVPAILTGNYPKSQKFPIFFNHPKNAFTLLSRTHDLIVFETATRLCPGSLHKENPEKFIDRYDSLLQDMGIIYSYLVLPPQWGEQWLPIDGLGSYWDPGEEKLSTFNRFLSAIHRPADRPPFYFMHLQLPHSPWCYLPSGRKLDDELHKRIKRKINAQVMNDSPELDRLHTHLLQVGLVDRLLGKLVGKLKQAGVYESSLVIVTADHGTSMPSLVSSREDRYKSTDLLLVPLFVKLPNQREHQISDRNVETIDILPTIADYLGANADWFDGFSMLDSEKPEKRKKLFFVASEVIQNPPRLSVNQQMLANKAVLFNIDWKEENLW